ncbi:MAG TPA: hypothetical protein VK966_05770, partial [Longimicrobiales bacterium]|nr:hypothetical protein [Longimicrobiales bacterium]
QEYLRPHDVAVLLQLAIEPGTFRFLADRVGLSVGETHNAAKRLELSRLAILDERSVNVSAAMDFLVSGVPYAFPPQLGAPARGVPTAHSAGFLAGDLASSNESIVWPSRTGDTRGVSLVPLLPAAVSKIQENNSELYELLTLVDAIRIGRARERKLAVDRLRERLFGDRPWKS